MKIHGAALAAMLTACVSVKATPALPWCEDNDTGSYGAHEYSSNAPLFSMHPAFLSGVYPYTAVDCPPFLSVNCDASRERGNDNIKKQRHSKKEGRLHCSGAHGCFFLDWNGTHASADVTLFTV